MAFATKQEEQVHLAGLAREREGEQRIIERLTEKATRARERGNESEAMRLDAERVHHEGILTAVNGELAKLSGKAQTSRSRAAKR